MKPGVVVIAAMLALAGCAAAPIAEPRSGLSDAEELLYAQSFALEWAGIDVPEAPAVPVVAYVPPAGWGTVVAGCMNAAGYADYSATRSGMTYPSRESDAEALTLYTCIGRFPVRGDFSAYANTEQLEYLYDYFHDSLIPCLAAEGYLVPGTAPSREEFTELTVLPRWNPYNAMLQSPPADVRERCPASPFVGGLTVRY